MYFKALIALAFFLPKTGACNQAHLGYSFQCHDSKPAGKETDPKVMAWGIIHAACTKPSDPKVINALGKFYACHPDKKNASSMSETLPLVLEGQEVSVKFPFDEFVHMAFQEAWKTKMQCPDVQNSVHKHKEHFEHRRK
jgi:hypothetical protein